MHDKTKTAKMSIYLPLEQREQLRDVCRATGMTANGVVKMLMAHYLRDWQATGDTTPQDEVRRCEHI